MVKAWVAAVAVLVIPAVSLAQTPAGGAQVVRAAGMPLQVGDLPPGTLAVRLVRGAFVENLAGRVVTLDAPGGVSRQATTDAQGRATFTLPVGSQVHAVAMVDAERLESETFAMPAAGGVRVLLVAGGAGAGADGVVAPGGALPPGHPSVGTAAAPMPAPVGPRGERDSRAIIAVVLGAMTFGTAGVIFGRARGGRR
jgi:hypothetical protein